LEKGSVGEGKLEKLNLGEEGGDLWEVVKRENKKFQNDRRKKRIKHKGLMGKGLQGGKSSPPGDFFKKKGIINEDCGLKSVER